MQVFEILDQEHYDALRGIALRSVYCYKQGHWKCVDIDNDFVEIKFQKAILGVSIAEREWDIGDDDNIWMVGVINNPTKKGASQIRWQDVSDFLNIECNDENIWDIPLDIIDK